MNNAQELKAHLQDSNKARMYEEKKKQDKLKTFDVVISEQIAKTIRVEAKNIDDAENIVNEGMYDDKDIIDEDTVDRMIVDSEEIKDE
jgi:pantothenate kinase